MSKISNNQSVTQATAQDLIQLLGPASADLVQNVIDCNMSSSGLMEAFTQAAIRLKLAHEEINSYRALYTEQMRLASERHCKQLEVKEEPTSTDMIDLMLHAKGLVPVLFSEDGEPGWDATDVEGVFNQIESTQTVSN